MSKLPKKNIWKIILTSHGKRIKSMEYAPSEESIYKKFEEEKNKSKSVRFPVKFINVGKLIEADYEIYLIKKKESEEDIIKLRDKDGTIRSFKTNNDNWIIIDRETYNIEETFWVYGYHPRYQRKDFYWIFNTFFSECDKRTNIVQIVTFKNKLIIKNDNGLNMIMCKNTPDCVRLYNELERECKENKKKYALFTGDVSYGGLKKIWKDKIKKLTNWTDKKILRSSLRP